MQLAVQACTRLDSLALGERESANLIVKAAERLAHERVVMAQEHQEQPVRQLR